MKKNYQTPTMRVVKLQHRVQMLIGSNTPTSVESKRQSYGTAIDEDWD